MSIKVKPLSQSISVTTANTVSNGASIICTTGTGATLITVAYANATVKGSVAVPPNYVITILKSATDTIAANAAINCTVGTA